MTTTIQQSALLYTIKVETRGTLEDGVTLKRRSYVAIESSKGLMSADEQAELATTLREASLEHRYVESSTNGDNHYALPVESMFTAIRTLEDKGWMTREHVPYFVWKTLTQSEAQNPLSAEHVEKQVGSALWRVLHPYQQVGVRFAVERKKAYIADEMGTGKTLQSLMICQYFQDKWPVLVVCPSSLCYTWRSEIMQWLSLPESDVWILKNGKQVSKNLSHKFFVVSYNLMKAPVVHEWLMGQQYQVVVLDEAHNIKNRHSKQSQQALKLISQSEVRVLLSGTPFNYPSEMFQQVKALYPEIYPWFYHFKRDYVEEHDKMYYAERYCRPYYMDLKRGRGSWVFKGYDHHEELNAVLNTFMIRRLKDQILTQLPEKNRVCITLDPLTRKQEKEIAKLLKEEKKQTRQSRVEEKGVKVVQGASRDRFMKSFRLASQYKVPHVIKFLKAAMIEDFMTAYPESKTLLFFHHSVMVEALEKCLQENGFGNSYFVIKGDTPSKKRDEYVQAFQKTDRYRFGLLSITAASVGLTLTAAQFVVKTEILFGPDLHLQAEDRAHRLGQKNKVLIFYLIEPRTTDDINFGLIRKKERESSRMLNGEQRHMKSQRISCPNTPSVVPEPSEKDLPRPLPPKLSTMLMPPPKKRRRVIRLRREEDKTENKHLSEDQDKPSTPKKSRIIVRRRRSKTSKETEPMIKIWTPDLAKNMVNFFTPPEGGNQRSFPQAQ